MYMQDLLSQPKWPAGHGYNSVEALGPRLGDLVELPESAGLLRSQLVEAHNLLYRLDWTHALHGSDALNILQLLYVFYTSFLTRRLLKLYLFFLVKIIFITPVMGASRFTSFSSSLSVPHHAASQLKPPPDPS